MPRSVGRICAGFYLAVSLAVSYIAFGSPVALQNPGLSDIPFFALIALHYLWGVTLLLSSTEYRRFSRGAYRRLLFVPELLAAASLLLFLFSYIFAMNANMDYVQRFIQSGGNLRLALDTETERLLVWVRIFPLVAINVGVYLFLRFGRYRVVVAAGKRKRAERDRVVRPWAFILTLLSAFLAAIAMPSFLSLDGLPLLGWVAFVPIFLVLRTSRFGHALFYGVVFGVFRTLLGSYWLGTFSLVSLQITVLVFFLYYLVFTPLAVHVHRVARWGRVLVFPLAWVILEYLRSSGFLGYPWALAAHSQYAMLPVIQMASVTGVWGVSFLVLFVNSAIAEFLGSVFAGRGVKRSFGWLTGAAATVGLVVLVSSISLAVDSATQRDDRIVRVAQIQQNNDPRKHEYRDTLETLEDLTNATLPEDPDLVVWSETAFVPNIRRWSVDTSNTTFHRLVTRMLEYQAGINTWLLTGNDDYEIVTDDEGNIIERYEFNAAVLFSDTGERVETYRKIQLVPFTEHFPYREQFPWIYDLLLNFDVHFWEPGDEATVFEHPLFRFSTPICYEDVFPNFMRGFVLNGTEAILNISNDFWSLTEVQAKQHFVAGLFRAVENRRPILRTTASGLTGQIDVHGRIIQTAPYYEEAYLVSDLAIPREQPLTIYTRFGDWFPLAGAGLLVVIWASSLIAGAMSRRRAGGGSKVGAVDTAASDKRGARRVGVRATRQQAAKSVRRAAPEAAPRPSVPAPQRRIPPGAPEATPRSSSSKKTAREADSRRTRKKRQKTNWRAIWDR